MPVRFTWKDGQVGSEVDAVFEPEPPTCAIGRVVLGLVRICGAFASMMRPSS
jgi:hypothetical protein